MLLLSMVALNAQNALPRTYEYDEAGNRIVRKTVELRNEVAQSPVATPAASTTEASAAYYDEVYYHAALAALGQKNYAKAVDNGKKA